MVAIDRSARVSVKPCPVGSKRDEVSEWGISIVPHGENEESFLDFVDGY